MMLWNSLTVHANMPPRVDHPNPITRQLRRLVSFVAMAPATHCSNDLDGLRQKRLLAASSACTTTHWPCKEPKTVHAAYPRAQSFNPIETPKQCYKVSFTEQEMDLVLGRAPEEQP
jgi:hypothetical protein